MDGFEETVFCKHSKADVHMNVQRPWQHDQDLHKLKPQCPSMEEEEWYKIPPLDKKKNTVDSYREPSAKTKQTPRLF